MRTLLAFFLTLFFATSVFGQGGMMPGPGCKGYTGGGGASCSAPTLEEDTGTGTEGGNVGGCQNYDNLFSAMKFTTGSNGYTLCKVGAYSLKINLTDPLKDFDTHAHIYTDSGGLPGTQVGGGSDVKNAESLTNDTYNEWSWSSAHPVLSGSTSYWFVVDSSACTVDWTNYIQFIQNVDACTNCVAKSQDGSSWTAVNSYTQRIKTYSAN